LYLGTNQGLFYKPLAGDEDFNFVKGSKGQVWTLKIIDNVLFCGHNNGTYTVDSGSANLISDFPGTWDIKPIPNHENLLLQGNFNGLSILSKNNQKWGLRNVVEGFDISSRFFEFAGESKIIVNREYKGIFKLDFDKDYRKILALENEASKGIGASLVTYNKAIYYTCNQGVFKYSVAQNKFLRDDAFTQLYYGKDDDPIGIFISDEKARRLWCFTNDNIAYAAPGKLNGLAEINKISIPSYVRKNMGVLGFEGLTLLEKDNYLIGMSNGYLTVDLKKLVDKEYGVLINSISKKAKDSEKKKVSTDSTSVFKFSNNNLFFSYHVPEYDKYTEAHYQYQLEGIYSNWSDWSGKTEASFENLPYGNYTFNVRAKVGNTLSSNIATYEFKIARPWYVSNIAIILYILSIWLLGFVIHKLYKNYYKKQREQLLRENKKRLKRKKLKAQKKIVQINNEKLKEEVDSKNRELAISTMSIIKKNEFLSAIKDRLVASGDNPEVQSVIRTIDRNINNVDDWKFFEDAFNNADKDFLKEIAPLLNISVRSVEVKRYRLRKKMSLEPKKGLADHIMEI